MITIQKTDKVCSIYSGKNELGLVELYENAAHAINCYVKLEMKCFDNEASAELFSHLKELVHRPLQAMVESDDVQTVAFLAAGGFVCKRKCYEVEAYPDDYIGGSSDMRLFHGSIGTPEYEACCRLMYRYYAGTHKEINPLTAGYEAFCAELPTTAIYAKCRDQITSLAFIEDNEIAYVCGRDKKHFGQFAKSLALSILAQYGSVLFEADDCDWAAMMLKALFINQRDDSFDTYVLK